jgi:CheY-like chemotaxis protein
VDPFDLIVADPSMPAWTAGGVLKTLKADTRTSEVPVIFLSAHDDYREALRAARSGAHDYLAKTGRSEQVVTAALKTITPRLELIFHLLVKEPVEVRTASVGLQWFLRAVHRLGSTGVLSLEDDWGQYQVAVRDGQPVGAQAVVQGRRVSGLPAFVRTMVARGALGAFTFGPLPEGSGDLTLSMEELIGKGCEFNAAEAKTAEKKLARHRADLTRSCSTSSAGRPGAKVPRPGTGERRCRWRRRRLVDDQPGRRRSGSGAARREVLVPGGFAGGPIRPARGLQTTPPADRQAAERKRPSSSGCGRSRAKTPAPIASRSPRAVGAGPS